MPNRKQRGISLKLSALFLVFLLSVLTHQAATSSVSYFATVVITPMMKPMPQAFAYYRSNTGSGLLASCKERLWNGSSWSSEVELPFSGSSIRYVRVEGCPLQSRIEERIVVTLGDDGYLDAYVWNGSLWLVTNNIAYPGPRADAYKCFDVAYEKTSGRALLVYSRGTTKDEVGYKIWDGSSWGSEQLLNLAYTGGIVRWISMASKPTDNADEVAMIYLDSNNDVQGCVWNGSGWSLMGATAVWDSTAAASTAECIAVAYEQTSGRAMFIWGDSVATDNYYRIWDGSKLGAVTLLDIPAQKAAANWVTLKSDPKSNGLLYMAIDRRFGLNTAYWDGAKWTVHPQHDAAVDTNARRCADFEWEPSDGKGLLVWGTTANSLSYKTFTAPSTWSRALTITAAGRHVWVQLRRNTDAAKNVKILGAMLNSNFELGALKWDGTTLTNLGDSTFTSYTAIARYECFEILFNNLNS